MWISPDGRVNTNSWGDPSAVLSVGVMRLVDSLSSRKRASLADALFQEQQKMVDALQELAASTDQAVEQVFLGVWMPREVVEPIRFGTVDDLVTDLTAIDLRWRLDALLLVEEYALAEGTASPDLTLPKA